MSKCKWWDDLRKLIKSLFSKKKSGKIVLDWRYGGFKPSSDCVEDRNLEFVKDDGNGVTFRFPSVEYWGSSHENPTLRCCAFYKDGDKYVGGFWEWGSKDRSYRAFQNIKGDYNGWVEGKSKFLSASKRAYVVCSKDGKHMTNIVTKG